MNSRELALMMTLTLVTLAIALLLLRAFAPGLLGVPRDLELVQVSEEVPPFYENVFRASDFAGGEFMIRDPMTRIRMQPLLGGQPNLGPHDILGFRNDAVPNVADIVTIGDSQTYGNNVPLPATWPQQLRDVAGLGRAAVYSVAVGGWGAVQYYDMFRNVTLLRPQVVVVAFYSGNDPLDSFVMAYGNPLWSAFRVGPGLTAADAPRVAFPPPAEDLWPVAFDDGTATVMTPTLRLASNRPHPAVDAGWAIMLRSVNEMARLAAEQSLPLVVTAIPTKELAFAPRIAAAGLDAPPDYAALVQHEQARIAQFAADVGDIAGVTWVDLVGPLQAAVLRTPDLYPPSHDGHPLAEGNRVIADAVAGAIARRLPAPPADGLYAVRVDEAGLVPFILRDGRRYFFRDDLPADDAAGAVLMPADAAARFPVAGYVDGMAAAPR